VDLSRCRAHKRLVCCRCVHAPQVRLPADGADVGDQPGSLGQVQQLRLLLLLLLLLRVQGGGVLARRRSALCTAPAAAAPWCGCGGECCAQLGDEFEAAGQVAQQLNGRVQVRQLLRLGLDLRARACVCVCVCVCACVCVCVCVRVCVCV
jgi:hypothetical protein